MRTVCIARPPLGLTAMALWCRDDLRGPAWPTNEEETHPRSQIHHRGFSYLRRDLTSATGGHSQQTLAAPGPGDHHPADRRWLVCARVQGLPDLHPVLVQP